MLFSSHYFHNENRQGLSKGIGGSGSHSARAFSPLTLCPQVCQSAVPDFPALLSRTQPDLAVPGLKPRFFGPASLISGYHKIFKFFKNIYIWNTIYNKYRQFGGMNEKWLKEVN